MRRRVVRVLEASPLADKNLRICGRAAFLGEGDAGSIRDLGGGPAHFITVHNPGKLPKSKFPRSMASKAFIERIPGILMTSAVSTSYDGDAMETTEDLVELIRRIGVGDRASFAEFYDKFSGLIYSTALRVLADPSDAEDVAQEVFFMLWEKAPMYDPARGKPLTWAITMTRNKAIDRLRSQQRRSRLMEEAREENGDCELTTDRQPTEDAEHTEENEILRSAVMKLSKEQREAIEMAYFKGLTQQEIAVRLHEPLGTVKARIRRGIVRLRKMVGPALKMPA